MITVNMPTISLGRTFEVTAKRRSHGELFRNLKVGDRIKVTLEMVKPDKNCLGLTRAPLLIIKDLQRDTSIQRTLVQTINMMSLFEWREVM